MKYPAHSESDESLVIIIDDDISLREAMSALFSSKGMRSVAFASAGDMLQYDLPAVPSCLVLDVRLPGFSGLELQSRLNATKVHLPIIFITGFGDVATTVKAMKAGAIDFLAKPFLAQDLLDAVVAGIETDRLHRALVGSRNTLLKHYQSLSKREQQVMTMAVSGLMNKQMAGRLGLSEITVKMHRANAMKKMQARTFADLVKMAEALARDACSPFKPCTQKTKPPLIDKDEV